MTEAQFIVFAVV